MTADQTIATMAISGDAPTPRLTGPQPVTDELIASIGTSECGWSRKQLKILGVPWPPKAGWRQRIVATKRTLSAEQVEMLYAARKKKRPENLDGPDPESPLIPTPCPWCGRLVEPVMQGGHLKEFCNKRHRLAFNNALTTASIEYARLLRVPGTLRLWTEARVNSTGSGANALQAPEMPNGEPKRQDGPSAPPRDEAQ